MIIDIAVKNRQDVFTVLGCLASKLFTVKTKKDKR
jgi:hypothetical protein